MPNQYENEANLEAHVRTTGPEIWRQTEGKVTHFVAGLGTCGTITGNGRFLKSKDRGIQVIGVHPEEGHDIPGVRSLKSSSSPSSSSRRSTTHSSRSATPRPSTCVFA